MSVETRRSDLWLLAGFFLGIVGGIIAYLAVKKDDLELARRCLYVGMASTAVWVVVPVLLAVATFAGSGGIDIHD